MKIQIDTEEGTQYFENMSDAVDYASDACRNNMAPLAVYVCLNFCEGVCNNFYSVKLSDFV